MKWTLLNLAIVYVVACADNTNKHNDSHTIKQRIIRSIFWPVTVTSWFYSQNVRLSRLLNILWTLLIGGWLLSLIADKL